MALYNMLPVYGIILSKFILGEKPTGPHRLDEALVVGGSLIVALGNSVGIQSHLNKVSPEPLRKYQ
jgi:drug/metabolite transporter (DMT)-like permease